MNTALLIRKATPADIPAIRQIAFDTWPSTYGSILSQEQIDYMLSWMYSFETLQKQMQEGHQFYIAELSNTTLGFAGMSRESNTKFKLHKLYVVPTTQKTGAGKALLQQVIEFARDNGGTQLILQVNRHNNAKVFYEKQGFTVLEEVKLDIGNGFFMDDYIMQYNL
jgi:N-acetylglutamate synthase-like GNAT family acetyltransferase